MVLDAEHGATGGELSTAQLAQLFAAGGGSAITAGLAIGEAEDGDLDATVGGERKSAAEGEALIVRMCGDAEQSQSHEAVSSRTSFAKSSPESSCSSSAAFGSQAVTGAKVLRCRAQGPSSARARRCSGVA